MKYYLIEVIEHSGIPNTQQDYKQYGYFTNTYKVNKGYYVGHDKDPNYENVTRFTNKKLCENKINRLRQEYYGGETNSVEYEFKCIEMELEPLIEV